MKIKRNTGNRSFDATSPRESTTPCGDRKLWGAWSRGAGLGAPPRPQASPGAVGALADEQRLPGAADGAIGLVPVLVVQEEAVQERVLGERRSGPLPPAPSRTPPSHPLLPAHLARGAHPPLEQGVLRVHLETAAADAQVWGDRARGASLHRQTRRTKLTGVRDPRTEKHEAPLEEIGDPDNWEGAPRSGMLERSPPQPAQNPTS